MFSTSKFQFYRSRLGIWSSYWRQVAECLLCFGAHNINIMGSQMQAEVLS